MHQTWQKSLSAVAVALILGFGAVGLSRAQDGHKHGAPLHGGKVTMTKEYHFEAVFAKNGLKVFPRTHEDKPIDASRLTGTATFYHPNSPKPWFELKLAATASSKGQAASSVGAAIDLSKVPPAGAKVEFKVEGLPEAAEPTATFTVPFALATSNEIIVTKATQADEQAIAALKVCPVSKEDLNDMGGPLKVTRGDKSTFICCKNCLKDIQANPDKFFSPKTASDPGKSKDDHHGHNH
jgi:hypothetical protein